MNEKLKEKVREALTSVLPITGLVLLLSISFVPMEIGTFMMFMNGALLLIIGMGFFQLGAEMAMTPLGQGVGAQMMKHKKVALAVLTAFMMGALITIAEPDLQVLSNQVEAIPNRVLICTVAVGVGVFAAIAVLRVLYALNPATLLTVFYALLFPLTLFTPREFLAVAFDAGGVTTGPITVPFIMAMGVGLSAARSDSKGGTIVRGRRRTTENVAQFLNLPIQEEQDFVWIIVPRATKSAVMSSIAACGLNTKAHGIIASMPVAGLEKA